MVLGLIWVDGDTHEDGGHFIKSLLFVCCPKDFVLAPMNPSNTYFYLGQFLKRLSLF